MLDAPGAEAVVELLLPELPQPVRATAADAASATNMGLGTGCCSCLMVRNSCYTDTWPPRPTGGFRSAALVARREHLACVDADCGQLLPGQNDVSAEIDGRDPARDRDQYP